MVEKLDRTIVIAAANRTTIITSDPQTSKPKTSTST